MAPPLLIEHHGPITVLTLNRPDRRNALGAELIEQLISALATAEMSVQCRAIVIAGRGEGFCAGLDLKEAQGADEPTRIQSAHRVAAMLAAIRQSSRLTIAAVHGAARAGGAGIVAACDLAIATRDATFGFSEVRRGLVPALVAALLRRQMSERAMRELFLVAEPIDAARAMQLGLINSIIEKPDAADVRDAAVALATTAIAGAPEAMNATKNLLDDLSPRPFADDFAIALAAHDAARGSEEAAEGIAAFVEHRLPNWNP